MTELENDDEDHLSQKDRFYRKPTDVQNLHSAFVGFVDNDFEYLAGDVSRFGSELKEFKTIQAHLNRENNYLLRCIHSILNYITVLLILGAIFMLIILWKIW